MLIVIDVYAFLVRNVCMYVCIAEEVCDHSGSSSILYLPSDFRVAYVANISEHLPTQP